MKHGKRQKQVCTASVQKVRRASVLSKHAVEPNPENTNRAVRLF